MSKNRNKAANKAANVKSEETGVQFMWTWGHEFNSDKHKLSRCIARFFGYMLTSLWADRKGFFETLKRIKFHFGITFNGGFKMEFGVRFPKTL